ncbi:oxidoreductase NAD-binding domain/2Fe-2S iron-sulfur cluster binding domain protein [Roseobacter sp. SK209-2-6]|uniref:PDR/VanB family oxidoreductase n=1 Tax=Roseobacter sp. SK209-2-6 TaxID=388739 RepID=UPI0000F3C28E|nr:PDR/VanB family oxidoreductase [Roseobacter sp. SK209-2-6]EBA15444.1 oxidoreductase NAD-binding domain/2Fe-2S iron-sulfur cluster binding domain protein [Roseobacter sp. SK209-2-6]
MSGAEKIRVKVTEITPLNELVTRFRFEALDGSLLPTFSGGAHTVVEMQDGGITRLNPYSLMSDPYDQSAYTISVRRDDAGRGGSLFMHNQVKTGDEMVISYPVNLFSLDLRARKHLFIAGGIGITPFLAQIHQLERFNGHWELHYSCRSEALGSYADELTHSHPNETHIYYDDQDQKIALHHLLEGQPLGTHVYVCGPKGMIDWVKSTAEAEGWPADNIHYEEFLAPKPGKPFQVKLAISNKVIEVGEHESLLEAMEREGVDAPYLCRGGACGQCETRVIDYQGNFIHRDHWLDEAEHASGGKIMPCVSRFEGKTLVLDR